MRGVVCVLVALSVSGCAAVKPVARTVDDAARILCGLFFAEKEGLSAEEAGRMFCSTKRQLQPWIDEVLAAKKAAGAAAIHSRCADGSCEWPDAGSRE